MKFHVSRTSVYDDETQPCENSVYETYTFVDVRTFKSFEEFNKRFGSQETWCSRGVNHCINAEGYIQREIPDLHKAWFIEIDSLDDLLNLTDRLGDIIVGTFSFNPNIPSLEIYDSYRE